VRFPGHTNRRSRRRITSAAALSVAVMRLAPLRRSPVSLPVTIQAWSQRTRLSIVQTD
jgi:hypothetical protein